MKRYKLVLALFSVAAFYLWLIFAATTPELPSEEKPLLFYSNQKRQDLKLTLCHALKKAQTSLNLQMYAITDPDILSLLEKSEKRGIIPKIIYDKSASGHLKNLNNATAAKGKGLMHRKIVVVDHAQVFLGSTNMTSQSLRIHDNLMVGIYHPELAEFLEEEETTRSFSFSVEGQPAELWLLPDANDLALKRLLQEIDSAKEKISIAIFTITHPKITKALIAAKRRGVKVKVAVDFFTERGASHKAIETLSAEKIPIYCSQGRQLLHHKWALIDRSTLIVGSANWTKAAFTQNRDCLLILKDLRAPQINYLRKLWKIIELESELKVKYS